MAKATVTYKKRDRIRTLDSFPLPSGKRVFLIGLVDYLRPDGLIEVRIITPGIYGGGIMKFQADEIDMTYEQVG